MRHLRVMRDYLKLDPVALPVRSSRADELRAEGFQTLAGWEEGLAFAPQAVVVATDTTRHLADATRALAAGADVLIEKPLSPTVAGIKEFAELSVASGRRVFVACNLRFDAGLQLFRKQLSEIGRIHAVRIECQSYLPSWRPGTDYRRSYSASAQQGGVLRDLIHEIDYAIWLFGPPMAVIGHVKNSGVLEIEAEESADLIWEAQSGATVSLRLDYLTHTPRRRMQALASVGSWSGITSKNVSDYFRQNRASRFGR
jgi:predicted dehydrogenase